ncbi:DUF3102 domain-containing protein [Pseudomonas nitroreducens]|uniref:DUF3102 domain-containing protein n=1 Tax=Pseudomonas nitroreducens TaxID=46680 RepID=UPI002D7F24E1|nr:DUF3102 domain-containing protein [Pseudomonas nitroreducens]
MGRIAAKTAPAAALPALDGESISKNVATMAEHSAVVMAQFGDGLPYDRVRVVNEARFYMAQSAEAMLEAGKRLVVLKEHEPHGDFIEIVESSLGIHERAAQRMMKAALKYLSPQLQAKATTLSVLGKSKLFELVSEDDEELAALADGGTVAGLALDDIDRMSCRELRKALRDVRQDKDAQGQVLADTNTRLQDAKVELLKVRQQVQVMTADERVKELRQEVIGIAFEAEADISGKLREAFSVMAAHAEETGTDHRGFQAGLVRQLEMLLLQIREEFQLPEAEATGDASDFGWIPPAGVTPLNSASEG